MKYADYQNTLSLQMIYAGYSKVGTEWCYKNVVSPFTRLYLINEGHASVYMNHEKYDLKEGDMFIIPKFTFHEYECLESMGHYYICFLDQLIGGRNPFEYASINYCPKASELDKYLMERFIGLNPHCALGNTNPLTYDNRPELFSINREKPIGELKVDIESSGILLLLFSRFLKEGTRPFSQINPRMVQVFNHINNHLDQRITVAELAEIMCVSPDHFIRIFKQINGMTPNKFLQHKRVERAQTLMLSSDMSLTEIARKVGVPNLSQFSRLFHQQTGIAPKLYMQNTLRGKENGLGAEPHQAGNVP